MAEQITNRSQIEIEACDETIAVQSNETTVNVLQLHVVKTAGCNITAVGHHIDYCVRVTNDSGVTLYDLVFRDTIDSRTSYVTGSFTVDGTPRTPTVQGHTITYVIPELRDDESINICFRVRVNS